MKSAKKRRHAAKVSLLLGVAFMTLTGCASENGKFYWEYGVGKELEKDWNGSPIQAFESRFGAPVEATTAKNVTTMKWRTSKVHWMPRRFETMGAGPNMTMTVHKPPGYEVANCVLAVSSEGGLITDFTVRDDARVEGESFCLTSFSRKPVSAKTLPSTARPTRPLNATAKSL
ncbi:hypothetical protein [Ensifer adhaerens]|uniref:hypothetical protein n=1 Tax=Ensifer adhaerens TaxID=106592 RepID=UPI001178AB20|nr:hypothetical protein [Ensifer adhaerens]